MSQPFDSRLKTTVRGNGNQITTADDTTIAEVTVDIEGNNNTFVFSPGCRAKKLRIAAKGDNNHFTLGAAAVLSGAVSLSRGARICIGDRSTFGKVEMVSEASTISIGADCMFSYDVAIRCTDTHAIYDIGTQKRINFSKDIVVEDYVWVGKQVTILKGVTLSTGTIVGLGSIVSRDTPAFSVVVGVPARAVRENVIWTRHQKNGVLAEDPVAMSYLRKYGRI